MNKTIIVFSGPSGAGKSTLIKYILEEFKSASLVISCTTRPPRDTEQHAVDYYFVSNEQFDNFIQNDDFIEHVSCYGNRYGTLKRSVQDILEKFDICILDLDYNGAYNVLSNKMFDHKILGVLILPPSLNTLKSRLLNRNSETDNSLNIRLKESFTPKQIAKYDHVVINKDIAESKDLIKAIILSEQ